MFKYLYKSKNRKYYFLTCLTLLIILCCSILDVSEGIVFMIFMNRALELNNIPIYGLVLIGIGYLALTLLFNILSNYLIFNLLKKIKEGLEEDLTNGIIVTDASSLKNKNQAYFLNILYNKVEKLGDSYFYIILSIFGLVVSFVLGFIYISTLHYSFIILIVIVILLIILSILIFKKPMIRKQSLLYDSIEKITNKINVFASFLITSKMFGYQSKMVKEYNKYYEAYASNSTKANTFAQNVKTITTVLGLLLYIGIYVLAVYLTIVKELNAGEIVSIVQISITIVTPFFNLSWFLNSINSTKEVRKDLLNIINKKKSIDSLLVENMNNIKLNNLEFGYEDKVILKKLNYEIDNGDFLWVKGESGCGKTTLFNILTKQINDYKGEVLFNDIDYKNISDETLYKKIKMLDQSPTLIESSLKENIVLGSEYNKEKINTLLKLLKLDSRFNEDSFIESTSDNLSLGEKRRVALARVLYSNFELLILDEPFESLDKDNIEIIMKTLKDLKGNKTIIISTHIVPDGFLDLVSKELDLIKKNS